MTEVERESVEAYVKDRIAEWLEVSHPSSTERRLDLIERIVRVEEAIKNQNFLMEQRFEMMERRFEMMEKRFEAMDKRFEAMDKRFDDLIHQIDKRFEEIIGQMDKRFGELREDMNRRFATMQWMMFFGFTLIGLMVTVYRFLGTTG